MAKLLYTWAKVQRGDIISFIYQNKEGRRLRRTILVLEPELEGLVHGIQLEISNMPINDIDLFFDVERFLGAV